MSGYIWDLAGTDRQCGSYGPGHQIHWIHFNHSMREPSVVIPVTAVVDDGLVHIEGDDVTLALWNHRPALLRAALDRFGGMAEWKPRWHLLAVPTEAFMGFGHRHAVNQRWSAASPEDAGNAGNVVGVAVTIRSKRGIGCIDARGNGDSRQ
jgi:hypothetical protein